MQTVPGASFVALKTVLILRFVVVFAGVEIGQFEIAPVLTARIFVSPSDDRRPGLPGKAPRDRGGGAGDRLLLAPGTEHIGSNPRTLPLPALCAAGFRSLLCHRRRPPPLKSQI